MHPVRLAAIQYFYGDKQETVIAVADRTDGVSHHQIYDLLHGKIQDPTHLAKPLFNATGFLPFAQALLQGTVPALLAVEDITDAPDSLRAIEQEEFDIYDTLTAIRLKKKEVLADGKLTRAEKREVLEVAGNLKKEVIEFIAALENDLQQERA